ncbi:asparaginase [Dactylosporangium sp. CA-092794]|uniref:asparaginase n=1 Tax=Dactylosporangium sp. CA-092794 TaxID=3239929 RepID=UPI003D8A940B
MRRVLLLATKDVIAYRRRPGNAGVATAAELLATVPAARASASDPASALAAASDLGARVEAEDVMAEPGWDMEPTTMLMLARRARSALADEGYAGVVVTHGLDTIEDTAYLTDLLAGPAAGRGGIVLTGATRALDDPDTDGPANLAAALTAAADPATAGLGAVVCLDGELHAARWVTLADALNRPALTSAPHAPVARVRGGRVERLAAPPPRPPAPTGIPDTNVTLIKVYPGIDPILLTTAADAGARGIVLEGTGLYNVPASLLAAISDLTEWDIPVVIASRSRVPDAELALLPAGNGLAAGVGAIGSRGLPAGKARAALMVALSTSGGVAAARKWFASL